MSAANERLSPAVYWVLAALGVLSLPLSVLAMLEAVLVWGSWQDEALMMRLLLIASPFVCIPIFFQSLRNRRHGETSRAIGYMAIPALFSVASGALIIWAAVQAARP